ncbi:MAG: hypothetical protein WC297_02320 [Candidatus Paceibacterota bacterium]|jgi:hypothetical protein
MKNNNLKLNFTLCLMLILFSFLIFDSVNATSTPQFLSSWKAYSYTPDWYQGKAFPIYSTPIDVSFELIDNNQIANISAKEIRWYINDSLFTKGTGLKNIRFIPKNQAGTNISIRIAVVNYKGEELNKFIYIPVKNPEAIINSPYLTQKVKIGGSYHLEALPFFFNALSLNDFSFGWAVNNQAASLEENETGPDILNLNVGTSTPSGLTLNISASISNTLQSIESAAKNLKLTVQ